MQVLFWVCVESCSYIFTTLTDDLVSSTSMSSYKSTTGTGELSQKSSTSVISHSESRPAEVRYASKC